MPPALPSPPPLNPTQDRLARGCPVPISSHLFHRPQPKPASSTSSHRPKRTFSHHSPPPNNNKSTSSNHSHHRPSTHPLHQAQEYASTTVHPATLPPDEWRAAAIKQKAAKILGNWESLAWESLRREESIPQVKMRFGAVMIDAEKEVDDDMAGTGTNISSGSGRRQGAGGPQMDTTSSTNSNYKGKGKAKAKAKSTHELIREFQRKFPPGQPHPGWVDEVGDWAEEQARRKREKEKKKEEEKQSRENVLFSLLLHSEWTHQDAGTDMTDTGNYDNDDDNDDDMVLHGYFEAHDGNDAEDEDGFFVADDEDDNAMEY